MADAICTTIAVYAQPPRKVAGFFIIIVIIIMIRVGHMWQWRKAARMRDHKVIYLILYVYRQTKTSQIQ